LTGPIARDGSDVLWDLLHEFGNDLVDLAALFIQKIQLRQKAAHLDVDCMGQEAHSHRLAG